MLAIREANRQCFSKGLLEAQIPSQEDSAGNRLGKAQTQIGTSTLSKAPAVALMPSHGSSFCPPGSWRILTAPFLHFRVISAF